MTMTGEAGAGELSYSSPLSSVEVTMVGAIIIILLMLSVMKILPLLMKYSVVLIIKIAWQINARFLPQLMLVQRSL